MTTTETTRVDEFMASLRRAHREQFEASPALQAEFLSAENYAAYQIGTNARRIKIMCDDVEATENEAAMRRAVKSYRFSSAH